MNLYGYLLSGLLTLGVVAAIFYGGMRYERGEQALDREKDVAAAVKRGREDAAVESAIALAAAKSEEANRTAARDRQHKLELELARDESARNCRVSDGTFRVLSEAIRSANTAPGASGSDGRVQPAARSGGTDGLRPITLDLELGRGIPSLSIPPARAEGVD